MNSNDNNKNKSYKKATLIVCISVLVLWLVFFFAKFMPDDHGSISLFELLTKMFTWSNKMEVSLGLYFVFPLILFPIPFIVLIIASVAVDSFQKNYKAISICFFVFEGLHLIVLLAFFVHGMALTSMSNMDFEVAVRVILFFEGFILAGAIFFCVPYLFCVLYRRNLIQEKK